MSEPTNADVEAMQRESLLAARLFKKRAELIKDFKQQLASIDEQIRSVIGDALLSDAADALEIPGDDDDRNSPANTPFASRTPRARNPHGLGWYILIAMKEAKGVELSEGMIVKKVLAMGYQTNAVDFQNSVYTTLFTLQRKGLVVKSENMWTLTNKGVEQAEEYVAERKANGKEKQR